MKSGIVPLEDAPLNDKVAPSPPGNSQLNDIVHQHASRIWYNIP